ncbi:alpha-galactosidase [Nonomuraea aridisoli]|uniref:Alpha-galactosidase n=1 Tax=Nonomuraea aridisoli TaxID=2070368 RepID=A0A2W2DPT8_9ACTN|nr:alpha-galactosidase [Nonomuraea aridisoli]
MVRRLHRLLTSLCVVLLALSAGTVAAHASEAPGESDQGAPAYYNSGHAPVPYMGWNTYYAGFLPYAADPDKYLGARSIKRMARYLVDSGLAAAGYDIVWLDGGWNLAATETGGHPVSHSMGRDEQGNLRYDPERWRFDPDKPADAATNGLRQLTDHLHALGLKAGIYTDAGPDIPTSCSIASNGHYQQDFDQFVAWGFDAVKVDFLCGVAAGLDPATTYREVSKAVAGRMILNICNPVTTDWGDYPLERTAIHSYSFGATIADSWRTGTDSAFYDSDGNEWTYFKRTLGVNEYHPEANGPGHYNDPDYLLPTHGLTFEEARTQFGMWAIMAAPLVIGTDVTAFDEATTELFKNPEVIAVDRDPLAIQGVRVASPGAGLDVYSKRLSQPGTRAVALLNTSESDASITVNFADTGLTGPVQVRRLWERQDAGGFQDSYTTTVPRHGVVLLKLTGAESVLGTDLGGEPTGDPAIVRQDETHAVAFVRGRNGALYEQRSAGDAWTGKWRHLGGPTHGRILGQPAAVATPGGRLDVFVRGTDNAIWQRTSIHDKWGRWLRLGGSAADAPGVAWQSPDDWTLFVTGADGRVQYRTQDSGWADLGSPTDGVVYGRPSAAVGPGGRVELAVRGNDDHLYLRSRVGGQWSGWQQGDGTLSGSPTLTATATGMSVFARAADYKLWRRDFADGQWGGWYQQSSWSSDTFTGALGVAPDSDGKVSAVVSGTDGHVHLVTL